MKKETITIDLGMVCNFPSSLYDHEGNRIGYLPDILKIAQVPERCTLTEAVEKFGKIHICELRGHPLDKFLETPEDVKKFKYEYLNKKTLEDGIYEAKYIGTVMLHYIKDGRAYSTRDMTKGIPATDLINPVKIAEI